MADTATAAGAGDTKTGAPDPTKTGEAAKAAAGDGTAAAAADNTKTGEAAAAATKTGEGAETKTGSTDVAAAAAAKAPEKYELTLPDGSKEWLDANDLKSIEATARAKGWTNEQAQAAINEHADALAAQSASFRAITEADEGYGGDKLKETQRLAALALDKLRPAGTPRGDALRSLLVKSGYGNNLEVVSMLADLGKLMAEDSPLVAGGSGETVRDAATVLYGGTTKS